MKNYDYVPDQPHCEHPDRCGEDMEPDEEGCDEHGIEEVEESGGGTTFLKRIFMRPGAREIE